jgi:dipeptidyl aminopeptidase/acylaminoacyl peptidase
VVRIAPAGTWISPIGAEFVASAGNEPQWVDLHGGEAWWAESRPAEGGRVTLLRTVGGHPVEVLPGPWNVRNRVHEYGGRPWTVLGTRAAFTHWDDQRIYLHDLATGGEPRPITPEPLVPHGFRYADLAPAPDGEAVWCVRETVTGPAVERTLVSVRDGEVRVLAASHHFMTGPKPSPDGRHAAWIGWNHPDMPWDATELCVAPIEPDGTFGPFRVLAGGPAESVCQFVWEGDGTLLALTDPDGWWNLHRIGLDGSRVNLAPAQEELGGPLWTLGRRWFAPLGAGRHLVLRAGKPALLDEHSKTITDLPVDPPVWTTDVAGANGTVVAVATGPATGPTVVRLDPAGLTRLTEPAAVPDPAFLPVPVERTFAGPGGRAIPAIVYPPRNPDFAAPQGEPAPYVVHAHGGPTWHFQPVLNPAFSYLTSRGIGVVAVNYGGSAGFGRAYREALAGRWGVVDVADCAAVAEALVAEGVAARVGIRGGSAGGWTAAASVTTRSTYACATLMFPMLDVTAWADGEPDTHDFESRYVERLIGALPEHRRRYAERSPMCHVDRLACPTLLLHGEEDPVCPAEQARRFVARLDGSGIPHAYVAFAGEQHGFRRAETVRAAIEAELSFYGQVFGFDAPEVPVLNLRG